MRKIVFQKKDKGFVLIAAIGVSAILFIMVYGSLRLCES